MPSVRLKDDPPSIVSSQQPVIVCFQSRNHGGSIRADFSSAIPPIAEVELRLLKRSAVVKDYQMPAGAQGLRI